MRLIQTNQQTSVKTLFAIVVMVAGITLLGLFIFLYSKLSNRPTAIRCPDVAIDQKLVSNDQLEQERQSLVLSASLITEQTKRFASAVQKDTKTVSALQDLVRSRHAQLNQYFHHQPQNLTGVRLSPNTKAALKTLTVNCLEYAVAPTGFVEVRDQGYILHTDQGQEFPLSLATADQEGVFTGARMKIQGVQLGKNIFVMARTLLGE